jgi:hypothetical protein
MEDAKTDLTAGRQVGAVQTALFQTPA